MNKKIIYLSKQLIIRLLIAGVPLGGLYFFAQLSFKANRQKEHPTDVGLGIAFLLIFILLILFIGFTIDFIARLRRKQYEIALIDVPFLIPFVVLLLYLGCLMSSRDCFCEWIINTINF